LVGDGVDRLDGEAGQRRLGPRLVHVVHAVVVQVLVLADAVAVDVLELVAAGVAPELELPDAPAVGRPRQEAGRGVGGQVRDRRVRQGVAGLAGVVRVGDAANLGPGVGGGDGVVQLPDAVGGADVDVVVGVAARDVAGQQVRVLDQRLRHQPGRQVAGQVGPGDADDVGGGERRDGDDGPHDPVGAADAEANVEDVRVVRVDDDPVDAGEQRPTVADRVGRGAGQRRQQGRERPEGDVPPGRLRRRHGDVQVDPV